MTCTTGNNCTKDYKLDFVKWEKTKLSVLYMTHFKRNACNLSIFSTSNLDSGWSLNYKTWSYENQNSDIHLNEKANGESNWKK